jgi:integrase
MNETGTGAPSFASAALTYVTQRVLAGKKKKSYVPLLSNWCRVFGEMPVDCLSTTNVLEALNQMATERSWSAASYNTNLVILTKFLTWCRQAPRSWIHTNPILGMIERQPLDNKRERWLNPQEIDLLVSEAPGWMKPIITFASRTGMRRSNVLGIRVADVQGSIILVRQTKNGTPLRWPLTPKIKTLVDAQAKGKPPHALLFPGPKGKHAEMTMRRMFPNVVRRAGLAYGKGKHEVSFHTFRHSMASNALNAGMRPDLIMALGHWKDPRMVERYAHSADSRLLEAASQLETILTGKSQ